MRVIFLYGCFLLSNMNVWATHIAGGGIELSHIDGNRYRINVILYFDRISGNPRAKDEQIKVHFFDKRTNNFIFSKSLELQSEERVSYTQLECSNGEIITDRLVYSREVILDPNIFNDPAGYYVVWERCCRNYAISNMFSEDPEITGSIAAGNTFYLAFPAVVKEGKAFINSSPSIRSVLNDYACPGVPYYARLTAQDSDGDSLAYSIVIPYSTHTREAIPLSPHSGPYPTMEWRQGHSKDNIMGGTSRLSVENRGILTVTPQFQGLYAVAVKVEEYRDKELIGTSIRDYQILVVDQCDNSVPPSITGPTSVTIPYNSTGSDRCIKVTVFDADSQSPLADFTEQINIRTVGLNFFDEGLAEILPANTKATLKNGATKDFFICFPKCSPAGFNPYKIGIIAEDDACSLPLLDTLKVTVNTPPPPDMPPYFVEPTTITNPITVNVVEGDQITFPFAVQDDDGDTLSVAVETDSFVLADAGIEVEWNELPDKSIRGTIVWNAFCDVYDFSQRTSFKLKIQASDLYKCGIKNTASLIYDLNVILPQNNSPIIDTDLTPAPDERLVTGLQRKVFESISFEVTGEDRIDNDLLVLGFLGSEALGITITQESNLQSFGINFPEVQGTTAIQSTFSMNVQCSHINSSDKPHIIDLQFIVVNNEHKCNVYRADTVQVDLEVLPPDNTAPRITINSLKPTRFLEQNNGIDATIGDEIVLGIQGFDAEPQDSIYLNLIVDDENPLPTNYIFQPAKGKQSLSTTFTWVPDCSIFQNGVSKQEYKLQFHIEDDRCFTSLSNTAPVKIRIRDVDGSDVNFKPTNFFSPNGDGKNDYYAMLKTDTETGELINIFPNDNCFSQFQSVRIYNRWGTQVFKSASRDFKWYGDKQSAGVYYYIIQYSNKTYKGPLSIQY